MKIGAYKAYSLTLIESVSVESVSLLKYLLTSRNQSSEVELLLLQLVY